jgi:hypothetical protein
VKPQHEWFLELLGQPAGDVFDDKAWSTINLEDDYIDPRTLSYQVANNVRESQIAIEYRGRGQYFVTSFGEEVRQDLTLRFDRSGMQPNHWADEAQTRAQTLML